MKRLLCGLAAIVLAGVGGCGGGAPSRATSPSPGSVGGEPTVSAPPSVAASPSSSPPSRRERSGPTPVLIGEPIDLSTLTGRIVFDDFEDVYTMNPDGSDLRTVAGRPGSEFDGAWSPDGARIVYRDSRRGINEDDEIFVVEADGSDPRNITNDPANDWGPDWSPDGEWIAFNSDRDGIPLGGYLVRPDGSDLTPLDLGLWFEYPSFSPDGDRVVFESATGNDYDIHVADLRSGRVSRLTDAAGHDGWAAWSPDGARIAFTTERDDCARKPLDEDCWLGDEPGEHHDIWVMNADGTDQRRVSPETGQFVAWSPDGQYLLVSGRTLFVIRPDGTGRSEIRAQGLPYAPGGIADWVE